MQDTIADMFTRIRNAQSSQKNTVSMPASKLKISIAKLLQDQGYIKNFAVEESDKKKTLTIELKYFENRPVIEEIKRVSRPGLRIYKKHDNLPTVNNGLGITIVSTNKGLMTDQMARKEKVGGEVIGTVF